MHDYAVRQIVDDRKDRQTFSAFLGKPEGLAGIYDAVIYWNTQKMR